ncbi:MAG: hypothetical protein KJ600_01280 [Nanoarchaeota archaeon]|nr:hypothetical protein [Nanoarchaeota archaeon]MBU1103175.1 hypothetical protein [Nanoarchaeota archaeon]
MKDEIAAGLRNALEREQSLEQATQSFVNAGYNPHEVAAAADFVSQGVSDIVYPNPKKVNVEVPAAPLSEQEGGGVTKLPTTLGNKKVGGKKLGILIVAIFLIVILFSVIGYLVYYLMK